MITNQISICCIVCLLLSIQLLFAYPENHVRIWLEILFLLRKKFHAKQIFVVTGFIKLEQLYEEHVNLCWNLVNLQRVPQQKQKAWQ